MAATQAESQRSETTDQSPSEQLSESRNALIQNGTDKSVGRVPLDGVVNTKSKSPMSVEPGQPRDGGEVPGHDRGERPGPDQFGGYRYPEGADPYYSPRPGFPGKPRPPQQQRFFPGQPVSQAPGPTPTLNSLLQSSGAPPHRYPNSYEQPQGAYGPTPGWPPPRPMPPYNPQGGPYRNSTPPRGYGGPTYGAGAPGPQQPPGAYGPPGSYPPRYAPPPGPPGAPNSRPPFSPHQGYERGGSPQPTHPQGAPSPGTAQSAPGAGGLSPNQDTQHPPHLPPGSQPPHQGYPPPPRPAQPSTPNAHDQDSVLSTLSFYASGSYQRHIGVSAHHKMHQVSVSNCVRAVTKALNNDHFRRKYIHFPQTREERNVIKHGFYQKFGMPGVLGCIDGTHIAIVRPVEYEERFINRKRYHSINAQIVCDSDLNILSIDASHGGANHDSFVWSHHALKSHLEQLHQSENETMWFLGDSGYPLRPTMMTPIVTTEPNSPERYYTDIQCRARNTIERCIGVLKSRWRCLLVDRKLHYHPTMAGFITNACVVLHNIANAARLPIPPLTPQEQHDEANMQIHDISTRNSHHLQAGELVRNALIQRLWSART